MLPTAHPYLACAPGCNCGAAPVLNALLGNARPSTRGLLRRDPARLTGLRRQILAEINRRYAKLQREIRELIITEDAFGLKPRNLSLNTRWQFLTNPNKLKAFQEWLTGKINEGVLGTTQTGESWIGKYITSAYKKGVMNSFFAARKKLAAVKGDDFIQGASSEFLRGSFGGPVALEKVQLLATRSYEQLKGVTQQMSSSMSRVLAQGVADGKNPYALVNELSKETGISKARAARVGRTEIMHAHSEGQLDSYEKLGVEELGVLAEWSTAGDDRVCPICKPLEGGIFTIEEARGLIPRHPNCRCTWIPANVSEDEANQVRSKKEIREAIAKSLRKETGKKSTAEAKEKSRWTGADKTFTGKPPQDRSTVAEIKKRNKKKNRGWQDA